MNISSHSQINKNISFMRILVFAFLLLSINTTAQETLCSDGDDNDGDGLYDCADPDCSASCPDAFSCGSVFYQRIDDGFFELNITTGNYDLIVSSLLTDGLHGGYNVRDGYMYGMDAGVGTSFRLYRIDRTNGAVFTNNCTIGGSNGFAGPAGDMDFDNHLYKLGRPGNPASILYFTEIDVSNCTANQRTFSTTPQGADVTIGTQLADIAFIPNQSTATIKIFYAIGNDRKLYKLTWDNSATKAVWEVLVDYGTTSPLGSSVEGYGALWFDSINNTLYASQNNTGKIFEIDLAAPANISLVQTGQMTTSNDGYNCSLAASPFVVLPVELISFTADTKDCIADLKWITASEENTAHFEVQQSTDGKEWATIEKIDAAINSHTEKNYNFHTRLEEQQLTYFRLKMVDLDGSFAYSPIRTTVCKKENHTTFIAYPNPANDLLYIHGLSVGASVKLVRMDGVICRDSYANAQEMELDLSDLPSGLYVLQVQYKNGRAAFRKITKR